MYQHTCLFKNKKLLYFFIVFFTSILLFTPLSPVSASLPTIPLTSIAPVSNTGYASFGSYRHLVVSNKYGIFFTYKVTADATTGFGEWRLMRSTDGGKTFTTVYKQNSLYYSNLSLETDSAGNLYTIVYNTATETLFYKFSSSNGFSVPIVSKSIPGASTNFSGKSVFLLDEPHNQLYAFTHVGRKFYIFDLQGMVKKEYQLLTELTYAQGSTGYLQYPLLYLNEGILYAAWTNAMNAETNQKLYGNITNRYTSIHFMLSKDGGTTWKKPDGTPLTLPVISNDQGPATMISRSDEPSSWLWSFLVKNGKAHFLYNYWPYKSDGKPDYAKYRYHYVRYNLMTQKKDDFVYAPSTEGLISGVSSWGGDTIHLVNQNGFLATKKGSNDIYAVSKTKEGPIGILVTHDEGNTWHDVAISESLSGNYGGVVGAQELSSDGTILGMFIQAIADSKTAVHFFTFNPNVIYSPTSSPSVKNGDFNKDGKIDIYDYNTLISVFGKSDTAHDLTGDKKIDIFDYNKFINLFGK